MRSPSRGAKRGEWDAKESSRFTISTKCGAKGRECGAPRTFDRASPGFCSSFSGECLYGREFCFRKSSIWLSTAVCGQRTCS